MDWLTDDCAQKGDPPARAWWGVNEVKPFEVSLHLPWPTRHKPYVALHVSQWGYELRSGRSHRILHIQLMWGRLFTDRGGSKVWHSIGRAA